MGDISIIIAERKDPEINPILFSQFGVISKSYPDGFLFFKAYRIAGFSFSSLIPIAESEEYYR